MTTVGANALAVLDCQVDGARMNSIVPRYSHANHNFSFLHQYSTT
jgi:hypothetical protein